VPEEAGAHASIETVSRDEWFLAGLEHQQQAELLAVFDSAGGLGFWGAVVLGGGLVFVASRPRELEAARR
jgi:hypothetical protein